MKGLSNIVSEVLLIGITVSIGVILMIMLNHVVNHYINTDSEVLINVESINDNCTLKCLVTHYGRYSVDVELLAYAILSNGSLTNVLIVMYRNGDENSCVRSCFLNNVHFGEIITVYVNYCNLNDVYDVVLTLRTSKKLLAEIHAK